MENNKKIILSAKPKEPLKRNETIKEDEITYIQQVNLINQLYMDINTNTNTNTKNDITSVIERELNKKLSGYKQQDIKKEIYNEKCFITYDDILEMLVACKIKCYYCRSNMKIIYKLVRDETQWSLDRIDNDDGHTRENTIICCLKCNLQRRCINKDKFEFTKKIGMCKIKKME
jgi:hypothetical protein